jgi:lysophospholipase
MQTTTVDFLAVDSATQLRYQIACPMTKPAEGSVLLLAGRGDCLELYAEVTQELTGRGFSVYTFDWRGQGLSTRPVVDRLASHVSRFEDYLNDLHQFVTRIWQPDTRHRFIIGQSLGAHLALRYLVEHNLDVSGALLCAPMIGVKTRRWSTALAPIIMESMAGLGLTGACIPGNRSYRPSERKYEDNPLTSDKRRFCLRADAVRQNPDLEVDGPTFGWMDAAFRSVAILNAAGYVE